MRKIMFLTVLLCLVLFVMPAYADKKPKDVNVVSPLPLPVTGDVNATVTTVYRFARFSTTKTTGYVGGISGMHSICQTDLGDSSARMCTTKEVILSPNSPVPGDGDGWVQPEIVSTVLLPTTPLLLVHYDFSMTPITADPTDPLDYNTCGQWGAFGSGSQVGTTIGTGVSAGVGCLSEEPVACCTPSN